MHDSNQALLDEIRDKKALSEGTEQDLRGALEKFSKTFAA